MPQMIGPLLVESKICLWQLDCTFSKKFKCIKWNNKLDIVYKQLDFCKFDF
jgi:hypothetical protein